MNPVERFFQFALLGLLTTGFLALAGSRSLDWPVIAISLGAIALRAASLTRPFGISLPPSAPAAATIACALFFPFDYYFLSRDFLVATIHGLCFITAARILTARTNRDYLYVAAVSFVQLSGAAFLSFQPSFFAWLALYLLFAAAALTAGEMRKSLHQSKQVAQPPRTRLNWRLALLSVFAAAGIVAITAGLFLIVPRTARVAARFLPPPHRLTGFTNTVDLGNFGTIAKDSRPVMHVLSYKQPLPPGLKWRGASLSYFDGRRWFEPPGGSAGVGLLPRQGTVEVAGPLQRSRRDGTRLLYRVDLDSSDSGLLFVAGTPEFVNIAARRVVHTASDSLRVFPSGGAPFTYEVSAHLGGPIPGNFTAADRKRFLQLRELDTRIVNLAHEWAGQGTAQEKAERIENRLRTGFTYTLETNHGAYPDPLAHFLLEDRRGYCEYFASAMAVMLRSERVPSRVATGFQSGYYNDVSGFQVIRASDAHAWVEAWIDGRGWITFDPTPPSAADRAGLFARWTMYLDAADGIWQQWVVSYDPVHQATLAVNLENTLRHLKEEPRATPPRIPIAAFIGIAFIVALWVMRRALRAKLRTVSAVRRVARGEGSAHDAGALYTQFLSALRKRGFTKPESSTPLEFADSLPGHERSAAIAWTQLYNAARFAGDKDAALALARLLRNPDTI